MSDFPTLWIPPVAFTTFGRECAGYHFKASGGAGSRTWPTANLALFTPLVVPRAVVVQKLGIVNGGTASGNLDLGIYDHEGNRLVSTGSTAQSGTSDLQIIDVTDTALVPGRYYIACAMDGTTATIIRVPQGLGPARASGLCQQASAFPLPATATFATVGSANAMMPLLGAILGRVL